MSKRHCRFGVFFLFLVLLVFCSASFAEEKPQTKPPEERPMFMFVQTAESGELVPVKGKENEYVLTLHNVPPSTIYFSDRPERIVGQTEMGKFLKALGFSEKNPPNAALELRDGEDHSDVVVVELTKPVYDAKSKTLQYHVQILKTAERGLAFFAKRVDEKLPQKFGAASLFIDCCPDLVICCISADVFLGVPQGFFGYCWNGSYCVPCRDYSDYCNQQVPGCDGLCIAAGADIIFACDNYLQ